MPTPSRTTAEQEVPAAPSSPLGPCAPGVPGSPCSPGWPGSPFAPSFRTPTVSVPQISWNPPETRSAQQASPFKPFVPLRPSLPSAPAAPSGPVHATMERSRPHPANLEIVPSFTIDLRLLMRPSGPPFVRRTSRALRQVMQLISSPGSPLSRTFFRFEPFFFAWKRRHAVFGPFSPLSGHAKRPLPEKGPGFVAGNGQSAFFRQRSA